MRAIAVFRGPDGLDAEVPMRDLRMPRVSTYTRASRSHVLYFFPVAASRTGVSGLWESCLRLECPIHDLEVASVMADLL